MKNQNNIEDKFFGKQVIKGIFAKTKFGFEKDVINVLEEENIDTSEIKFVNGKIRIPKNIYIQAKEALLNSSSITSLPKFEQFSRTGIKFKFADMGSMDKEGRATWSKLESQIRKYEDELRVFSKDGNFKSASFACTHIKSLYESLSALFLKASKNVGPKSSPYFSKKKFGKSTEYGEFTTKGGATFVIGFTENDSGTITGYLQSSTGNVVKQKVCKSWEECQFWFNQTAKSHNAVSQDVYARKGSKAKFSVNIDEYSIRMWQNEYGGSIYSEKNRGAWIFVEDGNTKEKIFVPQSKTFKEAVAWLKKNGKPNTTYKVAL